jgi:hypothetical protein
MSDQGRDDNQLTNLIDLELGLLEEFERKMVLARLEASSDLKVERERVRAMLSPIGDWPVRDAPFDLEAKILARVAEHPDRDPIPFVRPMSAAADAPATKGSMFRWQDLVGLAACLLIAFGLIGPGVSTIRNRAQVAGCAKNMRYVHQGMTQYASVFGRLVPVVPTNGVRVWLSDKGTPNSQIRFLLVKRGTKAKNFVCPSRKDHEPMQATSFDELSDFGDPRNCSYDSWNALGPTPDFESYPMMPVMGDRNPRFDGLKLNRLRPEQRNSQSHNGRGQNILRAGGSVDWQADSVDEVTHDDVYSVQGMEEYDGDEVQESVTDVFLVP